MHHVGALRQCAEGIGWLTLRCAMLSQYENTLTDLPSLLEHIVILSWKDFSRILCSCTVMAILMAPTFFKICPLNNHVEFGKEVKITWG